MKSRLITNLLLAVFVITLVCVAWLKPGQETPQNKRITDLDIDAIHHIKIIRKHGKTIELQQTENQWFLTTPIKAPALTGKIERLLKISQITPPVTYPLDTSLPDSFGLNPPTVQLSFNNETINIGKAETVNLRRYVSSGAQLFLLDDTFLHHLTAPVNAYIDTRLLPDGAQITGLQTPQITLQRQTDNTWKNTRSPTKEQSSDAVQMMLDEWRFARAIKVNSQPAAANGDDIVISFSKHKDLSFKLVKQQGDITLISANTNIAYTFSDAKYQKMTTLPALNEPDA